MPYVLILLGIALMASALMGTQNQLGSLLYDDMQSFKIWIVVILVVGVIGYVKPLQPLSIAFLSLILIALVLNNAGAFANLKTTLGL